MTRRAARLAAVAVVLLTFGCGGGAGRQRPAAPQEAHRDVWAAPMSRATPRREGLRPVRSPWQVVGVEPGGRALQVVYASGGCATGDGRATVREDEYEIRITVHQHELRPRGGRPLFCPLVLRPRRIVVALRDPVGGRPIGGPLHRFVAEGELSGRIRVYTHRRAVVALVPRVSGLAPGDATTVLAGAGFTTRTTGHADGPVSVQHPPPGHAFPPAPRRPGADRDAHPWRTSPRRGGGEYQDGLVVLRHR